MAITKALSRRYASTPGRRVQRSHRDRCAVRTAADSVQFCFGLAAEGHSGRGAPRPGSDAGLRPLPLVRGEFALDELMQRHRCGSHDIEVLAGTDPEDHFDGVG